MGDAATDPVQRFCLLASAVSGRALEVAPAAVGAPTWTDGRAVFVDAGLGARDQLAAVAVQASLLAAGSLAPDVLRRLSRRRALARRYLAVEGHRALAAMEGVLPRSLHGLIDRRVAARGDSPAASLASALSREATPEPPDAFGAIRVRELLARVDRAERAATTRESASREPRAAVTEELEDAQSEADGSAADPFTSAGGGSFGRWFQRALAAVRRLDGAAASGSDAPTHRARVGTPGGRPVPSTWWAASAEAADAERRGAQYPEWDVRRQSYREDWCTVHEVEPQRDGGSTPLAGDGRVLRRPLARLGLGLARCHRQAQGDDVDLDAAIEARVAALAGSAPDEAVHVDSVRRRRDLSVLVLLDVSGSVAERGATGGTVHEQQRAAAAALTAALHEIGDRVALYAYHSRGRRAVQLTVVKRFADDLDGLVWRRLQDLVPGAYSRLGAAIRHGAAVLEGQGGTPRRLLVVLSDGLAYDHGYEPVYGAADARRALAEARRRGTGCLCLGIGASTDAEALRRVFGSAAHATIPRAEELPRLIGPLFRSALRSAEARRRVPARRRR
jgi:nitric oxide reductase activation protein